MRIIVASSATIPGYSGGWTTTLDLLQEDHSPVYLIIGAPPGIHSMEGVEYVGLGIPDRRPTTLPGRLTGFLRRLAAPRALEWVYRRYRADFVLCLDEVSGFAALRAGVPYAMRFHSHVTESLIGPPLDSLLAGALFSTACQGSEVPGVEVLPHNQDLSRFEFPPAARPERALLLTCINEEHDPLTFVEGVAGSRDMRGDIIGTGPLRDRVEKACGTTGGRVRCLDPVPRLSTGRLSGKYQVGVATLVERPDINNYQMKTSMYLACGMHTLVRPFSMMARNAPRFVHTFDDAKGLSRALDRVQEDWESLEDGRREAREWVMKNCSVDIPRRRFREILEQTFGGIR
ncbi:MAG: hypothetical protein AVO35_01770 [Candidatus Aegiribacteria sp. MLS_C]|nr:MAG: hypothetical protein AVO35_01770 [Candidatus Aegiribacteria sp. MLS_C]